MENHRLHYAVCAGTLSARGFNIDSLTVSPTNIPDLSRMTIVMKDVPDTKATQVGYGLRQMHAVAKPAHRAGKFDMPLEHA